MQKLALFKRFAPLSPQARGFAFERASSFSLALCLLIWLALLPSCATQKRCFEKFPPSPADTVVQEKTVYRDTIIYRTTPADTLRDTIEVAFPCPPPPDFVSDTAKVENNFAAAASWLAGTKLNLKLELKAARLAFFIDSIAAVNTKTVTITKTQVVKEKFVPVIYKASLFVNIFLLLFVALLFWLALRRKP